MPTQYMDYIKISDPINDTDTDTGFELDIFNTIRSAYKANEIERLFSFVVSDPHASCYIRCSCENKFRCEFNRHKDTVKKHNELMYAYYNQCRKIFMKFRFYDRLATWMLACAWYCKAISDLHRTSYSNIQPIKHYKYQWKPSRMPSKFNWFGIDDMQIYGEAKLHNFINWSNYTYERQIEKTSLNLPTDFAQKLSIRSAESWVIAKTHGHLPD